MKLKDLKSSRASKVIEMKALVQKDEDSEAGLDEAEATRFDALKSEIDALDARIGRVETAMAVDADDATDDSDDEKAFKPVVKQYARVEHVPQARPVDKPGYKMARYAIGLYHAKQNGMQAACNFIENRFGDKEVAKSLNATVTSTQGPELIPQAFSTDFIELLRPWVAVRDLNPTKVDLTGGNLSIPRLTAGSTANYVGELQPIPTSQPAFDQLHLNVKKLAVMVPVSNDLLRRSPIDVEAIVRDDMVAQVARKEDLTFLRNASNPTTVPQGLLSYVTPGNKLTAPAVAGAVTKLDSAMSLLQAMNLQLDINLSRKIRPAWVFGPSVRWYLANLRDGVGGFPLKAELDAGTLLGFPYRVTQQLPTNLTTAGGTKGTEIYLVDFADVILGDSLNIQVKVSDVASYTDGAANQVNAFQTDETVFRLITEHDMNVRRTGSLVVGLVDSWTP